MSREGKVTPSRWSIVLIAFLSIASFYLLAEHQAHTVYLLPWLLLFVCPLLHFWAHGRHSSHGDRRSGQGGEPCSHRQH
jgi:hypothetical protein